MYWAGEIVKFTNLLGGKNSTSIFLFRGGKNGKSTLFAAYYKTYSTYFFLPTTPPPFPLVDR